MHVLGVRDDLRGILHFHTHFLIYVAFGRRGCFIACTVGQVWQVGQAFSGQDFPQGLYLKR